MNGTNGNEPGYPENALVPYPVIVAATNTRRPFAHVTLVRVVCGIDFIKRRLMF